MLKILSNFFARFSKRERFVLYVAAFFISLVLFDRLLLGPILSKLKSLDREIRAQEARIKKSLHILAQKDRILNEGKIYAAYVTEARSQEEELVFLLQEIEKIANNSAIYVIDIKSAGLAQEGILQKYLVKLNCEAQMEQLSNFFYAVESSKKLLKIEKYDIRPQTEGSTIVRCAVTISKAVLP